MINGVSTSGFKVANSVSNILDTLGLPYFLTVVHQGEDGNGVATSLTNIPRDVPSDARSMTIQSFDGAMGIETEGQEDLGEDRDSDEEGPQEAQDPSD